MALRGWKDVYSGELYAKIRRAVMVDGVMPIELQERVAKGETVLSRSSGQIANGD